MSHEPQKVLTKRRVRKVKKNPDDEVEYDYVSDFVAPPPPPQPVPVQQMRPPQPPPTPAPVPAPTFTLPPATPPAPPAAAGGGLVQLPKTVEMKLPDAPAVSKFQKRKKKARHGQIRVWKDAANSCSIEVDNFGKLICAMLSDDLNHTYLKFGTALNLEADPIILGNLNDITITNQRKPFLKDTPREHGWIGEQTMVQPWETMTCMSQNKHYKKIRVKKQKLKGKKAKQELLFAADKADLVVDEYTDEVGKVYVAFPDKRQHRTFLFALPERINVVTEEFSREIPIRRAANDHANWYVQDTSSEESEEEVVHKPQMAEAAADADFEPLSSGVIQMPKNVWDNTGYQLRDEF